MSGFPAKARRLAAGAFILNAGLGKWSADEQAAVTASEPKGAPPSGLTSEGARNERRSEEGRRRVKAPGGERAL